MAIALAPVLLQAPSAQLLTPMMKKNSKTRTGQLQEHVVEEEKPSSALKKGGNEIDEIFAGKKRKKSEVEKTENLMK
ncbi:hypothetical protein SESBI_22841 [Sesbania bispinosa]|nr:hypothetical protein SESBI_22841 [Sesbania bispinosa]